MQENPESQLDLNWLNRRFKELVKWNPEATMFDGLLYATVCLWRDLEPGQQEGEANLYDIFTTSNLSDLARTTGMDRVSLWRRIKDFRNDRGISTHKGHSMSELPKGLAVAGA